MIQIPANGTIAAFQKEIQIFPDTGYNLIALPVHWMGLQAFWFVCSARTMEMWRALTLLFEQTRQTHSMKFPLIWILLLFVVLIYCLRFTTWHLCFLPLVCEKHSAHDTMQRWGTPELSWLFSNPHQNPAMEVIIGTSATLFTMLALSSTAAIISAIDMSLRAEIQTLKDLLEKNCKHNMASTMTGSLQEDPSDLMTRQRSSSSVFLDAFDTIETHSQRGAVAARESNHPVHNLFHRSQTLADPTTTETEFAHEVEKRYRSIVRWLYVLRTTVGTVLSTFTVCIVATVAAFAWVDKMLWPHLTAADGGAGSVE